MAEQQLTQHLLHLPGGEPAPDRDRQALPAVFIHHSQQFQWSPILGAVHHEVIRPHMIQIERALSETQAICHPQPRSFGLLLRHLESFLPPDSLDALVGDSPAFLLEEGRDPSVPIPPIFTSQREDPRPHGVLLVGAHGPILLRGPAWPHDATRPAFRHRQRRPHPADRFSASGRA